LKKAVATQDLFKRLRRASGKKAAYLHDCKIATALQERDSQPRRAYLSGLKTFANKASLTEKKLEALNIGTGETLLYQKSFLQKNSMKIRKTRLPIPGVIQCIIALSLFLKRLPS
jgi:hypothetical protein